MIVLFVKYKKLHNDTRKFSDDENWHKLKYDGSSLDLGAICRPRRVLICLLRSTRHLYSLPILEIIFQSCKTMSIRQRSTCQRRYTYDQCEEKLTTPISNIRGKSCRCLTTYESTGKKGTSIKVSLVKYMNIETHIHAGIWAHICAHLHTHNPTKTHSKRNY